MKIGKIIKRLRLDKGLTQENLAHKAGITFVSLNRIENGFSEPQESTLRCIADVLGVEVNELKGEE